MKKVHEVGVNQINSLRKGKYMKHTQNGCLFNQGRKFTKTKGIVKRNLKKCLGGRKKFPFTGIGALEAVNGREVEGYPEAEQLWCSS